MKPWAHAGIREAIRLSILFWMTIAFGGEAVPQLLPDAGRDSKGRRALLRTVAAQPANADGHNALGLALMEDDPDEALKEFQIANRLRPNTLEFANNLALALTKTGQIDAAISLYEHTLRSYPNAAKLHSNFGLALWQKMALEHSSDSGPVIEALRRAAALEPASAEFHNNLGMALQEAAHQKEGSALEAIAEFRTAMRLRPAYSVAQVNLAAALCKTGNLPEARKNLEEVIAREPGLAEAHYQLGLTYREGSDWTRAAESFQRAIALKPSAEDAYYALGGALRRLGKAEESKRALERFQALSEKKRAISMARAHTANGLQAAQNSDLARAREEFQKAVDLAPALATAHNNLGWVLARKEELPGAIAEFRRALALRDDYPLARYNLGLALWSSGDKQNGSEQLRRAHDLDPRLSLPTFLDGPEGVINSRPPSDGSRH